MVYDNLTVERDGQIAVVTLNRPEKLNAIDRTLHLEMMAAGRELRDDGRGEGSDFHGRRAGVLLRRRPDRRPFAS